MSEEVERLIRQMEMSGDSQQLAVADFLRDVASNGEGQDDDGYLHDCAILVAEAAMSFAKAISRKWE